MWPNRIPSGSISASPRTSGLFSEEEVRQGRLSLPKDQAYEVELELSDGNRYPHQGKVNFADPSFSKETGTFLVRAEVPNPKEELRPGMFVKAFLKGAMRPNAIVVPQKAVQQTANGHMVYVVNAEGTGGNPAGHRR